MMPRLAILLPLTAIVMMGACRRKLEILPPGAKNVIRTDTTEDPKTEADNYTVKLREYRFTLPAAGPTQNFVCESREFPDAAAALNAAKKSIAERPDEELKSERAHFALSGRSLWLRVDRSLLWCMYAGPQGQNSLSPVMKLKESFISKFREAT
jgi:hypothetical protein